MRSSVIPFHPIRKYVTMPIKCCICKNNHSSPTIKFTNTHKPITLHLFVIVVLSILSILIFFLFIFTFMQYSFWRPKENSLKKHGESEICVWGLQEQWSSLYVTINIMLIEGNTRPIYIHTTCSTHLILIYSGWKLTNINQNSSSS